MPKDKNKVRKEIHLFQSVFDELQKQADEQNRSLKNFMESLLIEQAKKNEAKKE